MMKLLAMILIAFPISGIGQEVNSELSSKFANSSGNRVCTDTRSIASDLFVVHWRDGYFAGRNGALGLDIKADDTWLLRFQIICMENPGITVGEAILELYGFYLNKEQESKL